MDEDDLEYRPPGEIFIFKWGMGNKIMSDTRSSWARDIAHTVDYFTLQPPPWWLEQQDLEGRTVAKFAIWNKRYPLAKQIGKWLVAPLDDFRRAGYLVRR